MEFGICFATPLWKVENNLSTEQLTELQEWALQHEKDNESLRVSNKGGYHGPFSNKFDQIPALKLVLEQLEFLPRFAMKEWWVNINRKGNFNNAHIHAGYDLSLIWYLTDNNHSLRLEHPLAYSRDSFERAFGDDPFYNTWATFDCKAGDIIIFPSDIMHSVAPHELDTPRISIAMNISFLH